MKTFISMLLLLASVSNAQDKYSNFAELSLDKKEGIDYSITTRLTRSKFAIMAIHGGHIERGTSELAKHVAGKDLNLYLFEALSRQEAWDLHITSTNFDEPQALALAHKSTYGVSIHGFKDNSAAYVCMGGLNEKLKKKIFLELLKTGLIRQTEENPCKRFFALSKENIVNRCRKHGAQIEMSGPLRELLLNDSAAMLKFSRAIRRALN